MSEVTPNATSSPQMEMEMEPEPVPVPDLPEGDDTLFDFQPDDDSSDDDSDEDDSLLHDDSTLLGTSGEEASELTLETREERAYAESIARAQRKMKQDDYGTIHPGIGAGWPKKSLLEASGSSGSKSNSKQTQTQRQVLGSAAATTGARTEQSAAVLKTARANAVSRRDLTVRKLHQARRNKRMQQQQMQQEQVQQNLSTPRTPRKTLKLGLSAAVESPGTPGTPNTLNTTLSSMASPLSRSAGGRMTPTRRLRSSSPSPSLSPSGVGLYHRPPVSPPPPTARAYNRFFPPKMVETHNVEGTDSAVCVEPDAVTGEVELHIEEKIFMTDPVAASEAATTSQELFGASKWDQIAEMAKKELEEKGSNVVAGEECMNLSMVMSDDRSVFSQKSLPSVLGNESIFHDTAVQAVASLFSLPNYGSPGRRSSYEAATAAIPEGVSVDADEETGSAISDLSGFSTYSAANNTRGMFEATLEATPEMGGKEGGDDTEEDEMSVQSFITGQLEDFVQSIPDQMITPTRQLLDMIAAIHSNGEEEEMPMTTAATRSLMTRRRNACGTLKLLASKAANRTQLAWTGGILAALTSVLADSPFNYVDKATYNSYMVARERAVSALVCLSAEKDNRILLLHSPGLVHSLIKTIDEDDRECRLGCCVVLKNLSMAVENRRLMTQIPGLIDALLEVITGGNKDLITAELYDSSPNENLHAALANAFAVFMNLTKERENAVSPFGATQCSFFLYLLQVFFSHNPHSFHLPSLPIAPTCEKQRTC